MTQKQFTDTLIRHLRGIIAACIQYYGLSWSDFRPREENSIIRNLADNQSATPYLEVGETRPGS